MTSLTNSPLTFEIDFPNSRVQHDAEHKSECVRPYCLGDVYTVHFVFVKCDFSTP